MSVTSGSRSTVLATQRPAAWLPTETGHAVVVDDTMEAVHPIAVRERRTPHDGDSPRAAARTDA